MEEVMTKYVVNFSGKVLIIFLYIVNINFQKTLVLIFLIHLLLHRSQKPQIINYLGERKDRFLNGF